MRRPTINTGFREPRALGSRPPTPPPPRFSATDCIVCTCVGGFDYGVFPTPVFPAVTVILANETKVHYPVPIKNDDIVEKLEVFSARLVTLKCSYFKCIVLK